MVVLGSQQEAYSHGAKSFADITEARDESVIEPTGLKSGHQYHFAQMRLARCDWQQLLVLERQTEDR